MFELLKGFEPDLAGELSGGAGGLILVLLLMIITAVVFAVKFALDIAINKRFAPKEESPESEGEYDNRYFYAVKNDSSPKKRSPRTIRKPEYTIIPQDKLFILENPVKRNKRP